jgi:hypothetical protein
MRLALPAVLLAWSLAAGPLAGAHPRLQPELVIVKEGGKEYHRPGCELIRDGKGVTAMTRAQAEGRKLTSHDGCDPEKAEPAPAPAGKPSAAKPAAQPSVWVDGGRHYHKEDCTRLGKDPKKVPLADAGRKLWPCPECKPPIRPRPR